MVAISFSVFKDKLVSREKQQTIRKIDVPRLEQMSKLGIQIYWKQRDSKESEKLYNAKLKSFMYIKFDEKGYPRYQILTTDQFGPIDFDPQLRELTIEEQEELARRDGFDSLKKMAKWFRKKYGDGLTSFRYMPELPQLFMVIQWEEE